MKEIGKYIDDGGQFPTNIVINFKSRSPVRFDRSESFGDTSFGKLTLPGRYGAAWVIDGQHRLYGFAYAQRRGGGGKAVIPVLAYENLSVLDEMRQFVTINCEQVKVSRNLVNEILSNLNYESDDPNERLQSQYARIVLAMDRLEGSPIRNRVWTVAREKDHVRCLTLTSLVDGISENNFIGTVNKGNIVPGPLAHSSGNAELTCEKASCHRQKSGPFRRSRSGALEPGRR